jgi:4-hydroxybenzoate polyprenyltransferase
MATERSTGNLHVKLITPLHLLVFGSTLVVYNAPRIFRKAFADEHNGHGIFRNYRNWYFFFFAAGLLLVAVSSVGLSYMTYVVCGILGFLAFAYTLPILPFKQKRRLRDYGWAKILVLASVWTTATAVLPIIYHHARVSFYPFEILCRFIFIFTLCVIFDIRDMQDDLRNNLLTLPNKVGITRINWLINIALLCFVALGFIQYCQHQAPYLLISIIGTAIVTRVIATYLQKYPTDRSYMLLADGTMIVYSVLVLLG